MKYNTSIDKLRGRFLKRSKDYGLPIAILVGIPACNPLAYLAPIIPYMIIAMLFFSFLKVTPSDLRLHPLHIYLQLLQLGLSAVSYIALLYSGLPHSKILAEGIMICFFCPAASASPVVISFLGGNVAIGTTYVLVTSLGVTILAPIVLALVGSGEGSYLTVFLEVLMRIVPIILLPLLLAWGIRYRLPHLYRTLSGIPSIGFWIWVITLALIMAKTVHFMLAEPRDMIPTMVILGLVGLVACAIQFAIGKLLSKKILGESITLGQSLGQKNSSIALWLAQVYLNPLSSVAMAAYSIWQNLLNAYQIHRATQRKD